MKKLFAILAAILLTASVFAQSPEKMSYQAVIRNSSDQLVTDQAIGMQISILQGSASGTAVYVETQTPTTNANGLVSVEIGTGTTSDDFSTIDWANGPYFIKTETDPTGGTSYTITGTSQLLSVPYALHAKTAETVTGGITETDPTFTSSQAANIDATDITNLGNLSGVNTGDQDLSTLATKTALGDSTAQVRSEIPDVSGFLTSETDPTFTSSEAANITTTDITNLGNLSGVNTGDQDLSTLATKTALGDSTAQVRSEIPDVSGFLTTETDPTFTSSQAATIDATDITNLGNLSGVNTGDQDLSTLALKTNVLELDNTTAFTPDADYEPATKKYVDDNAGSGSTTYSVGDFAQGGIVFWVDETGQHGLVCAKDDQSVGVRWYAGTYGYMRATGDGLYAGEANTSIIIAAQVAIGDDGFTYAAHKCIELQVIEGGKTYGDWYLPSLKELDLMYQNKATIDATAGANGGSSIASAFYWSSTEGDGNYAWTRNFNGGNNFNQNKDNAYRVRAVRAF
jgi:hypothetical protein